jgi:hypothetical protein
MKTIKFLAVLCIILAFSANNAVSKKVNGTQTIYWEFTPDPGKFQIPCLTEVVSGTITEYQSFTNDTYHVRAQGVLYGETNGEEYDIDYEYNSYGINYESNSFAGSGGAVHYLYVNSMLLKHEGKLVAVIHLHGQYVINGNGVVIQDRYVDNVNCK